METRIDESKKLSQRSTEQRELIRGILQRADRHLDADEIYQQARLKSTDISLSTVYRNLQLFKVMGLVDEHQFGTRRYYEAASQTKHHHMVCLSCGRVFEFKCPLSEKLKDEITEREGFRVIEAEVRLTGYCPECQERLFVSAKKKKIEKLKKQEV
jgi:Fur family ferric uptake transcriptional regulator